MSPRRAGRVRSLKSRLALWVLLPTLAISTLDLLLAYHSTGTVAALVQEQLLKGSAKIISEQLSSIDGGYEISVPPAAFELFASSHHDRIFYSVHSKSGLLIAGDGELPLYKGALQIEQEQYFIATLRGEQVRVIAYKHALPSTTSSDYAITQIAQTLHGYDAFRHDLLRMTIREHLILFAILISGLAIAFRWTLRPLIDFGEQLLMRRPGSLEKLDLESAPSELHPIILAMNDYVVRLDRTLGAYEQFVANTAHHLRTSFAILTSQINFGRRNQYADPGQQEVLAAIQQTVAQGSKVINQLLVLATVEQKRQHAPAASSINLSEIIKSVIEDLAPVAQQNRIDLGIDAIDARIQIAASAYLLREVVANLVDNAIQHMGGPGSVTVSLSQSADTAVLRVVDSGPGIPEQQRHRVFERFYRIDDSKPHTSGLGLAIVKEICEALHATTALGAGDGGAGLCVEIVFPLAPPARISGE
ncbi:MAG: sensor histidine kinase [Pseudomonadota bacterium]|nr:sensor histidine kinase [Pseudomonadota bacterium]